MEIVAEAEDTGSPTRGRKKLMSENIDWLQSQSGLCKVERYTASEEKEEEKEQQNWTQPSSDPLKVLSRLRQDLEKSDVGVQDVLNASNNARRARTRDPSDGRQTMPKRNVRSPAPYNTCDEEFSLNVSSNRVSPNFHLSMKAGCQKEAKDEESEGSSSPNPNPDPDEVSFYCNRLSNLAIAMARKEMNDRSESTPTCIHNTLYAAAGDHGHRSIGVGTEDTKHIATRTCECRYEESPATKKKTTIYYKEENTEVPNKSEPQRDEARGFHHRKRFGPDEYNNSLSKGILVYANNVVSDMMVSVMKTMKVKVNDSNIACAVLKKVLLKHSKEVVSDLIDSCMKNLHDVTGTLMTDSDFVSAVKRSLFTQGSQKASEIVQAMLNRLHNALIVQKQFSEKAKSQSMAFTTIKTGQGTDTKTQNMRFSAAKTETMKDKEMTCAETVGNHIIKEGLNMWHQKQHQDTTGAIPMPAKPMPTQEVPDLSNLTTDSWARDLIVTALLLIQYHLVQQENAMKDAVEGGRSSKATGSLGFLAQDKGLGSLKLSDTLKQCEDEQLGMNAENDMSSVVVMLIQKLINETVNKLGGNTGTLMPDEAIQNAFKAPEGLGLGPPGQCDMDHSYEDAIAGLTKMILDQCDAKKEGGSGPFVDKLVDTVTKLCLMIAKYSNPESGLGELGDGEEMGGGFYSKSSGNAESRAESGEDTPTGRKVVVANQSAPENVHNKQLQAILQWVAASQLNVPMLYFMDDDEETLNKLQQLSTVAVERNYSVGDVMQSVLKYEKERQLGEALGNFVRLPVLDWLLQNL
ncbi:A-kinase anchor protein 3 isoform X1 [Pantherophis guttatus]|uniref:A-kinase anchor protein 3 isoform X1 n=1 Tax=Pantherophis guttatus TaxID=94885 RepID=A0ABM3ZJT1_PANGU|nr:A-kinase anchor protein 3 isoform X1 [Pantherophis guttatus]